MHRVILPYSFLFVHHYKPNMGKMGSRAPRMVLDANMAIEKHSKTRYN